MGEIDGENAYFSTYSAEKVGLFHLCISAFHISMTKKRKRISALTKTDGFVKLYSFTENNKSN